MWPIHQNRPGGPHERSDYFWDIRAEPFEYSNRYRAVSPETALEGVPRHPIACPKVADSRRLWPNGHNRKLELIGWNRHQTVPGGAPESSDC